jgi:hypothetical protein
MSQPLKKNYPKTMFIVEGISTAMLVIEGPVRVGRRRFTSRKMEFKSPEAALTWCRRHRARLVYSPLPPAGSSPAHN